MTEDATQSDSEIAVRAQSGDLKAFELLVQRHKGSLYRFVRRYVGSDEDAYDIVQDAFISAWLALKRFDQNKAFSTWIRAIALNKCRDFGRRQAVRRRFRDVVAFLDANQRPERPLEAEENERRIDERLKRLDEAIAELPPSYKEPLLLTTVSRLTHADAAKQLGITTKAVEMRIRRAKKKLAVALSDLNREG